MGIAGDIVIIVVAALFCGLIAQKLKLPTMLGYIVAGILVGPNGFLPSVVNTEQVEVLADIGVALLLFTVGIEFPVEKLSPVKKIALIGTPLQILASVLVGVITGLAFGLDWISCVWFGCIISVSSTMVVLKILGDRGLTGTLSSQVMTAILIVQDLAVIPMLILLPVLDNLGEGINILLWAVVKSVILMAFMSLVGTTAVPKFVAKIASWGSREIFMVGVLALGLGTGFLTYYIGLSFAFGAFLAGMLLSRSDFNHQALSEIMPLKDLFSLLFFVSVGMLIDLKFAVHHWNLIVATIAAIFIGKGLVFAGITRLFGYVNIMPIAVALYMFQVGEFAFVLARTGRSTGSISPDLYMLSITVAAITIAITPFFANLADPIYQWLRRRTKYKPSNTITIEDNTMRDHIIIVGYGNMGSFICKAIPFKERILVIEAHPNRVKLAKGAGLKVIGGDASSPILLEAAGLESAALAIITMPDSETATITAENIHNVNPSLKILARARSMEHMQQLISKGCSESIVPEYEASLTMLRDISAIMRFPIDSVNKILNQVRDKQYGPLLTQGDSEEDGNDTESAEDKKDG